MTFLCEVAATVICPTCGRETQPPAGLIHFQWGEAPHDSYRVNQPVVWLADSGGNVVPEGHYVKKDRKVFTNWGDPGHKDVIAFDVDPRVEKLICDQCHEPYEALAVEIHDGIITRGIAYGFGQVSKMFGFNPREFAAVIIDDGSYAPPGSQA